MPDEKQTESKTGTEERKSSNLPPTEIAKNENPRANENVREHTIDPAEDGLSRLGVGSEITDGEDA